MAERYNGWTNYETWNVALWLGNDESLYRYWRGQAGECWEEAVAKSPFTRLENATHMFADRLKDWVDESNPLTGDDAAGFYNDLLNGAISEVDWHEIAEHWVAEAAEEDPEDDDEDEEGDDEEDEEEAGEDREEDRAAGKIGPEAEGGG